MTKNCTMTHRERFMAALSGEETDRIPVMQATPDECRELAHACISLARGTRYMLSAGCEIPAETSDEVFRAFCDAPKAFQD